MSMFITPKRAIADYPLLSPQGVSTARAEIAAILQRKDPRLMLIVGPCSIHNTLAAKEYAERLKKLSTEVQDVFLIAMRTYFEKPRTTLGWKGLLYDPFLDGSNDMQEGIRLAREFLTWLSELGLPAAAEFLEPLSSFYLADCISWGSIGARTCQSPIHRQLASSLPMPIGFKNRSDGNVDIAIQACVTAKEPHGFLGIDPDGRACQIAGSGNPLAHLVLRGGETRPNFDAASIEKAARALGQEGVCDSIIVDCSHGNAQKNYQQQQKVFSYLIEQIAHRTSPLCGIMLESFLLAGTGSGFGQSITDPCLDWETTEMLILQAAELLRQKVVSCV